MRRKRLKSLAEHDARGMMIMTRKYNESEGNGIACPKCGQELMDTNPLRAGIFVPYQTGIYCTNCGYKGCRKGHLYI